jgi:hypothetical protein
VNQIFAQGFRQNLRASDRLLMHRPAVLNGLVTLAFAELFLISQAIDESFDGTKGPLPEKPGCRVSDIVYLLAIGRLLERFDALVSRLDVIEPKHFWT